MDLIDVACAAQKYGALSLTLIIPYFGYSTMERKTKDYEVVKAKVRARMLSAIPRAKMGNSILFLDLHSEGIPYYTEGDITPHHIYSEPQIVAAIENLGIQHKLCVASTDAGRAKWVQSIANRMEATPAFCVKTRKSGTETKLEAASNAVCGKHTVIFDDMIRTGGSLLDAVNAYTVAKAAKIDVATTHGIFPNNSHKKILAHPKVGRLLVSDSLPHVYDLKRKLPKADRERFIIMPYAKVWAQKIKEHVLGL
jgi:ribose-phosphate pyrophosphokinase